MSKRRRPGATVVRRPGSGFLASADPSLVTIPKDAVPGFCVLSCGDPECREWPEVIVCGQDSMLYHISECEMADCEPS
jgi:hypothetical protein